MSACAEWLTLWEFIKEVTGSIPSRSYLRNNIFKIGYVLGVYSIVLRVEFFCSVPELIVQGIPQFNHYYWSGCPVHYFTLLFIHSYTCIIVYTCICTNLYNMCKMYNLYKMWRGYAKFIVKILEVKIKSSLRSLFLPHYSPL